MVCGETKVGALPLRGGWILAAPRYPLLIGWLAPLLPGYPLPVPFYGVCLPSPWAKHVSYIILLHPELTSLRRQAVGSVSNSSLMRGARRALDFSVARWDYPHSIRTRKIRPAFCHPSSPHWISYLGGIYLKNPVDLAGYSLLVRTVILRFRFWLLLRAVVLRFGFRFFFRAVII